jgi:hypothetical protein
MRKSKRTTTRTAARAPDRTVQIVVDHENRMLWVCSLETEFSVGIGLGECVDAGYETHTGTLSVALEDAVGWVAIPCSRAEADSICRQTGWTMKPNLIRNPLNL